jgi:O-antigen/teichoic acid export membrane protein
VKLIWQSPTVRSMVVYALSGIGFTGSNLILARVLPTEQYALFTLVIALGNLGYALAPAGLDGVVTRRHLEPGPRLFNSTLAVSTLIGLAFGLIGMESYGMSAALAFMLFLSSAAGGLMVVASARFQSEQRFSRSLLLGQSPNIVLLAAALVSVLAHESGAWLPVLISTIGFVVAAWIGWVMLARERRKRHAPAEGPFAWSEALAFAGMNASGLVLIQLERLVIPHALPLADLALFGVLGAIAGSVYRVMQMGVGFSLLPRLRAAEDVLQRRRLVFHEARLVGAMAVVGSLAVWFGTPLVERYLLAGKYHLPGSLLVAAIVSGIGKIANAFSKATASAVADPRELSLVNLTGWISVALGVVGALFGAHWWGLTGLIYGVAVGWFLRAAIAFVLVGRHLRLPVSIPATAP